MTKHKLITIAVPSYNSAAYMGHCLDTLVEGGDEVEVLVINDGSSDNTLDVAKEYEEKYPNIIRAIDQENRGWGGVINHAMELATGEFFYIVDSDDWLDSDALKEVLDQMRLLDQAKVKIDLFLVNYLYNHVDNNSQHLIHYHKYVPADLVCGWSDFGHATVNQWLMIHSMIYRTSLLRESGLELPLHTPYTDSLFMLKPIRLVQTIYYHDCNLYWYTIGREGQSTDPATLQRNIGKQLAITKEVVDCFNFSQLHAISPRLSSCCLRFLAAMLVVSTIQLYRMGTPEAQAQQRELMRYVKKKDARLYRHLRFSVIGLVNRKTPPGRFAALHGYNICAKVFKFE